MEIRTDNEIIAEFMGVDWENATFQWRPGASRNMTIEDLDNYRTNWSWLMPVVEKIEQMERTLVNIYGDATKIWVDDSDQNELFATTALGNKDNKIKHVYRAIVEWIKWYNSQDTSNQPQKAS